MNDSVQEELRKEQEQKEAEVRKFEHNVDMEIERTFKKYEPAGLDRTSY